MKFGDSLWQRSVPQWRTYNIDYDGLKQLIKENTTSGHGKAVSIPGTGNSVEKDFSNQLFLRLENEYVRLGLFVKSRWYEINSRLSSIDRQLAHVQGKDISTLDQRLAWQIRRKFSRIESEILAVGEEIQNLSRFISINRLAIRKLTKKYSKWSRTTSLRARIEDEVLNKPGQLSEGILKPALEQYTTYLHDVRAPFEEKPAGFVPAEPARHPRPDLIRQHTRTPDTASKSAVHFDSVLEARSTNPTTTLVKYWVHEDNVTQLRILLLQHTSYAKFEQDGGRRASTVVERSSPVDAESGDESGLILLGDLETHRTEDYLRAAGTAPRARWCNNDAAVALTKVTHIAPTSIAKMPQSQLYSFLDTRQAFDAEDESIPAESQQVRRWLEEHDNMKPLVAIRSRRSRFMGLDNSQDGGIWASLDEEIDMSTTTLKQLKSSDYFRNNGQKNVTFQHAVLVVRCEGGDRGLFSMLDKSHLTERVPDFSIEEHALFYTHRPTNMPAPSWFHILNKDIRHVPDAPPITRSRKSSSFGTGASSPLRSSKSGSKSQGQETPETTISAPDPSTLETRVKSKLRQAKRHKQHKTIPEEPAAGYWNEYDDPDSEFGGESGGYVIYIDPNAPIYPGQRTLEKWYGSIKCMFGRGKKQHDLERQNSSDTLNSTESSDEDDEEYEAENAVTSRLLRRSMPGYGATPSVTGDSARRSSILLQSREDRDRIRLRHAWSSTICFAAAVIILSILTLLSNTGRKKARQRVEVGMLLGVAAALGFVGIGMGNLITLSLRRNTIGGREGRQQMWLNAFKWLVAIVVCIWAVWLGARVVL